jgi:hypothetical protein
VEPPFVPANCSPLNNLLLLTADHHLVHPHHDDACEKKNPAAPQYDHGFIIGKLTKLNLFVEQLRA